MSDRIKKIKIKQSDGTFSDYIPIGADAKNIDTNYNSSNVENTLQNLDLKKISTDNIFSNKILKNIIYNKQPHYNKCYGTNGWVSWYSTWERDIDKWVASGLNFVRFDITWSSVESSKDIYDFSINDKMVKLFETHNIRPYVILNGSNSLYSTTTSKWIQTEEEKTAFINFAKETIKHYFDLGYLDIWYEIFNEPDLHGIGVSNAQDYVDTVKEIYEYAKKLDNNITIISGAVSAGSFSTLTEKFFQLGLLKYSDMYSIHPYSPYNPEYWNSTYMRLKTLQAKYDKMNTPIFIGECGYSIIDKNTWDGTGNTAITTDETRAKYAVRMILNSLKYGMNYTNVFTSYTNQTDNTDVEHWFYIMDKDGTPTKTLEAITNMNKLLQDYAYIGIFKETTTGTILQFVNEEQNFKYIGWSTESMENIYLDNGQIITLTDTPSEINYINTENIYNYEYNNEFVNEIISIIMETQQTNDFPLNGDLYGDRGELLHNVLTNGMYIYHGGPEDGPNPAVYDWGIMLSYRNKNYLTHIVYSIQTNRAFMEGALINGDNISWKGYTELTNWNTLSLLQQTHINGQDDTYNFNNFTSTGFTTYNYSPVNSPYYNSKDSGDYGYLIVINRNNSYTMQLCFSLKHNCLYTRGLASSSSSWTQWTPNSTLTQIKDISEEDNLNDITTTGYYAIHGGPINSPASGSTYGTLEVINVDYGGYISQKLHSFHTDRYFLRHSTDYGEKWSSWKELNGISIEE